MRTITRVITAVALPVLAVSLSSCGSSKEPKSIEDLAAAVEKSGYSCQKPFNDPDYPGETEMQCTGDIGVIWYDTAEGEVDSYSNAESIYKDLGIPYLTIRGDTWHILGQESDLTKIASSMGAEVSAGGAR
ncbi:DUF4148 domain-containing protein [Glutamicibacter arilaitensis]|uniref:DUF4148 domain-containing protein n=1 Tax=Glutamicibacter arilaitensis TaxID=256701 RepID=UPI001866D67C|nr:DUF4148 domain-containing protein [Glutamicibacter arilaitensis]